MKVLVTAGPTIERIDDVRFISNFSSGKMGFAIAEAFSKVAETVTLITGPVNLTCNREIIRIDVESANDMFEKVKQHYSDCDIIIMSAAVADFTPNHKVKGKLKKDKLGASLTIEMVRTIDILAYIGANKRISQFLVGFALESENELEYGRQKMLQKNCDMMVINSSSKPDSGFGGDFNTITILTKTGDLHQYPPMSKTECAKIILNNVVKFVN